MGEMSVVVQTPRPLDQKKTQKQHSLIQNPGDSILRFEIVFICFGKKSRISSVETVERRAR